MIAQTCHPVQIVVLTVLLIAALVWMWYIVDDMILEYKKIKKESHCEKQ